MSILHEGGCGGGVSILHEGGCEGGSLDHCVIYMYLGSLMLLVRQEKLTSMAVKNARLNYATIE